MRKKQLCKKIKGAQVSGKESGGYGLIFDFFSGLKFRLPHQRVVEF